MENEKASGDLRRIQLLQVRILEEVDRICRKKKLKYYIIAGTLLGAVRHGGFIPWDSDIDIAMFRDDYEKFVREGNEIIDKRFFIQSDYSDKHHRYAFAKVRVNETKFIEKGNKMKDSHYGFYLDIFVLDDIKSQPSKMDYFNAKLLKLFMRIKAFRSGQIHSTKVFRTAIAVIGAGMTFFLSRRTINNMINRIMTKDNNKGYGLVTNYCSRYGILKQTMPKEVYGEPVEIEFEGRKFLAPNKYLNWLERIYGDYMKLPPPEKRRMTVSDKYEYDLGPYKNIEVD